MTFEPTRIRRILARRLSGTSEGACATVSLRPWGEWLGRISLFIFWAGSSAPVFADDLHRVDFNRDIRPILSAHCFHCHGPDQSTREAGLRLDTREGLFAELSNGRHVVEPNSADRSELSLRITSHDDSLRMPPSEGKPLTEGQIKTLTRWIEEGAPWRGHWSYEPVKRPTVPKPLDGSADNPIDKFLITKWNDADARPVVEADSVTLVRRLSFDLTGLPPSSAAISDVSDSERRESTSRLIEQFISSPRFGERMAVYWLDLVRYADSCGYHSDVDQNVSPYRDYVIHAFNQNMPFDQFTIEQLAGDLLTKPTLEQRIATGFNRLNKATEEGGAQEEEYLAKAFADRVRTVSGTWMAATLGCAECHDHKYDPLTSRDFYRLGAFFADVKERGVYSGNGPHEPEMLLPTPAQTQKLKELDGELSNARDQLEATTNATRMAELQKEIKQLEQTRKSFEKSIARTMITVSVSPREIRVLARGDWLNRSGEIVEPAVPGVFSPPVESRRLTRLDLAKWLTDRGNPLTARVFVNRLWKQFFGAGLAKNLDDMGAQSEAPTHPELLDWLAAEFMESGWDVKRLVRLMVTSHAYRLSSVPTEDLLRIDPHNRLFARQSRWRLEAEFLRDNGLAVSGLLVERLGGPSVKPYQPDGYWEFLNFPKRNWEASVGSDQYRRGLYTHWQRTFLHPTLIAFDAPSREECTAMRAVSNTPKASLALLNDPSFVESARVFASRILNEISGTDRVRVAWAWKIALTRDADAEELDTLCSLLESDRARFQNDPAAAASLIAIGQSRSETSATPIELAAWTEVARAIMNLHEFTTRN